MEAPRVEQQPEQPSGQRPKQLGGFTGQGFMPGVSGNPRGRALRYDREAAKAASLTLAFVRRYDRDPDEADADSIAKAAQLFVRLKFGKLDDETRARLSMAHDRAMRSLRMTQAPTPAPTTAPRPSTLPILLQTTCTSYPAR